MSEYLSFKSLRLFLIKAKRKLPHILGNFWGRSVLYMSGVEYGSGLILYSAPFIVRHFKARIVLGRNVCILNSIKENSAGISHKSVLAAPKPGSEIIIGDNVGMSGVTIVAWSKIDIGDNTQLGAGTKIYDTDFHALGLGKNVKSSPVVLGKKVWTGADCIILKGVSIGDGAVVAAGSVVTKDVEPYTVVGGVPARPIYKYNNKCLEKDQPCVD